MKLPSAPSWCALILLAALGTTGCQLRTFRTMSPEFAAHPSNYCHVAIAPIRFTATGHLDASFNPSQVRTQQCAAAAALGPALADVLYAKGYQVDGAIRVLYIDTNDGAMNAEAREILEGTWREIHEALFDYSFPGLRAQATNAWRAQMLTNGLVFGTFAGGFWNSPEPFHYELCTPTEDLAAKLGRTNSDALLLIDSRVFFESPRQADRRAAWNATGGTFLFLLEIAAAGVSRGNVGVMPDPFQYTCSSVHCTAALVDPYTRQVLWFDERHLPMTDARKRSGVKRSVETMLHYLPATKDRNEDYFKACEQYKAAATNAAARLKVSSDDSSRKDEGDEDGCTLSRRGRE